MTPYGMGPPKLDIVNPSKDGNDRCVRNDNCSSGHVRRRAEKRVNIMLCALVPLEGSQIEVLPCSVAPLDVLEQGPLHCVDCGFDGWKLYWTSGSYHLKEVNEFATSLAKQLVKGDACLVHPSSQQHRLDDLLQSRHQRRAAASGPRLTAGHWDSSRQTRVQQLCSTREATCIGGPSSNPAVLKRARSSQRIAAAHHARQRILNSMAPSAKQQQQQRPGQLVAPNRQLQVGRQSCCSISSACQDTALGDIGKRSAVSKQQLKPGSEGCSKVDSGGLTNAGSNPHPLAQHACSRQEVSPARQQQCQQQNLQLQCQMDKHMTAAPTASGTRPVPTHTDSHCPADPNNNVPCFVELPGTSSSPAAVAARDVPPPWDELPEDIVGRVAGFLGNQVSAIMPVYLTCRSWRRAVLDNDKLLTGISFHLSAACPFRVACGSSAPAGAWQQRAMRQDHPALLQRAAKLGNVSALVTSARLLDAVGASELAMRMWRRAAKRGHVEGQLLYGLAQYRGAAGVPQDPEDAHIWLCKALKQVQQCATASTATTSVDSGSPGASSSTSGASSSTAGPNTDSTSTSVAETSKSTNPSSNISSSSSSSLSLTGDAASPELVARVQSQAGLVLGYLCFDGEGTRSDKQEAVKYFKLSAAAGWGRESREAAQVLGWIWNTGQY